MKIDTADLSKKMISLTERLEDYCNLSLDRAETEISEGSSETVEVIESILNDDRSNLLRIVYGKRSRQFTRQDGSLKNFTI